METMSSSETSVDYQRTTRRYAPEDRTLHNHRCENIKFYGYSFPFQSDKSLSPTPNDHANKVE
jgi:hypothetical protein